jgi:hypothetical protein
MRVFVGSANFTKDTRKEKSAPHKPWYRHSGKRRYQTVGVLLTALHNTNYVQYLFVIQHYLSARPNG